MARKILIVEDEQDLIHLLEIHLRDINADVTAVADGDRGLELALARDWDLIILDIMLPGMDGLDICRRIRKKGGYVPILMLTAKDTELDRVVGLELGADDYVTKPFSIRELLARIKALFRRVEALEEREASGEKPLLQVGAMVIDSNRRRVSVGGREVDLTAREFDLLEQLARHPGRVYTREQLLDLVWGYSHEGYEHTVISHINRLRGKVEKTPGKPRYILTVRGVGYRFAEEEDLAD